MTDTRQVVRRWTNATVPEGWIGNRPGLFNAEHGNNHYCHLVLLDDDSYTFEFVVGGERNTHHITDFKDFIRNGKEIYAYPIVTVDEGL